LEHKFQIMRLLSKFSILVFLLFSVIDSNAQKIRTQWDIQSKKISDCEYDIVFKVKIEPKWHMYSTVPSDGPLPTEINFKKSKDYELVGKIKESKPHEEMDEAFGVLVKYFTDNATFTQRIKLLNKGKITISGDYSYQICIDVCETPPAEKFNVVIDSKCDGGVKLVEVSSINDTISKKDSLLATVDSTKKDTLAQSAIATTPDINTGEEEKEDNSLWGIFIKGFLGGLFAVFTPCLFPLIPMNVSFFTKRSKTKAKGVSNALMYSGFVILIYILLGIGITLLFGPDRLHAMSTNKYVNMGFFAIFLVFAISFFGAFEITLPSRFVNKMDSMSDKGGIIGIFFMAFTLVLVSFSCTGPIASSLLIETATTGKILGPALGMFGFGLALALPFGFFAFAPALLNSLPKSGGWLNSVKVCLGFIELAFAMKFLSNADLVTQSHYITREVFLTTWIVLFGLMGAYLLGAFRMSHDSKLEHVSIPRLLFAITSFLITIYILPGLWGAPVKLLSGILPPSDYSESPHGFGTSGQMASTTTTVDDEFKKYIHIGAHGIPMFKNDYEHALAYAKKVNKPLMIDFTGHNCANCRKTEDNIWSDEAVKSMLANDVVVVSLYCDEDTELPVSERKKVFFYGSEREIETVGMKWKYFQNERYKSVQQPLYVIVDHNEKILASPRSYKSGIEDYKAWLNLGVSNFKIVTAK